MKRIGTTPRNNWQEAVEKLGFGFHTSHVPYWNESAYYSFHIDEINAIEKATAELWDLCLLAVDHIIEKNLFKQFHIPAKFVPYLIDSWNNDLPSIYGRFDLCCKNGEIKLLEFNADTPTSLYEAAIVQWFWLRDFDETKDQFNSIHEKLIDYWNILYPFLPGALHFSCLKESLEDLTNIEYLRDCAIQAGLTTRFTFIEDIGWDRQRKIFVDMENSPVKNIFKLYHMGMAFR